MSHTYILERAEGCGGVKGEEDAVVRCAAAAAALCGGRRRDRWVHVGVGTEVLYAGFKGAGIVVVAGWLCARCRLSLRADLARLLELRFL